MSTDAIKDLFKADKGLVVIFIIAIILANAILIFKTVRAGGFLYKIRSLTLISLAIGDIFLALFSLVVKAKQYYLDFSDLTSQTIKIANIYSLFFIHFVYAVGLIVLAVELVHRYKRQVTAINNSNNIVKSIICSAMPWLLGLVIVLPITMAETNTGERGHNFNFIIGTFNRVKTMFGVTVVLPVCLALIVCIVVMCIRLLPVQYTGQIVGYQGATPGVVIATHNTGNVTQQYPINGVAGTQQMITPQATYYNPNNTNFKHGGPDFNPHVAKQPQYNVQQYPPQQYPPPQYLPQQQIVQSNVIVAGPVYSVQPQAPAVSALQDPGKEKNTLLVVSIILFVCVMPLTVCSIGTLDITFLINAGDEYSILMDSLFWVSMLRSIITPIIWSGCSRN